MKLTLVFLTAFFLNVSAKSSAQKVTLNVKNVTLVKVFREIERQTGYGFLFTKKILRDAGRVTLDVKNEPVNDVLQLCFSKQPLNYTIQNYTILISRKPEVIQLSPPVPKPIIDINGIVKDEKGNPLAGVSVILKGTNTGTSTDVNGHFSINANSGDVLEFTFVGYQKRSVTVGQSKIVSVVLDISASVGDEVVVVGYGTQKKINLTGAVDVVSGKALQNRPAATVSQLLEGTSPNLNITPSSRGGEPGAASNWNIRGLGSSTGSSPLILIDGVEGNVDFLDPETIESVTVLKDASASAIYGSRAPFGVVLVTTKKGTKNKGVTIQYNTNFAWASPLRLPEFVDALTWATVYNQIQKSAGLSPVYPVEQVERIKEYMAGTYKPEYDTANPPKGIWRGRWEGNANYYNYPELFFKKNSFSPKHNISLQGGDSKTQYFVSGGYYNQGGLYSWGDDSYKRYNLMANVNSKVNNWLSFDFGTKYTQTLTDYPLGEEGTIDRAYYIHSLLTFGPMTPMYNTDGIMINPLAVGLNKSGRNKTTLNDLWLRIGTEIEPIKGWKTNIAYNYNYDGSSNAQNPQPVLFPVPNGTIGNFAAKIPSAISNLGTNNYFIFNAYSTYEKTLGGHFLKAMIGYEEELMNYNTLSGSRSGVITTLVPSINAAVGASTLGATSGHWANQAVFGRLNYNFRETFLFELSGRYNGSSRFAKDSRWGFFPSSSVGYNISKEDFWAPIAHYVNTLKIRASYGSLGNQNVPNYMYVSNVPIGSNLNYIIDGTRPIYANIPSIIGAGQTWETITTLNLGLDASFLDNRLDLTFDKYWRKTSNMFGPVDKLPQVLGASAPEQNNAELQTKGFELQLGWKDRINSNFNYTVNVSLADNTTTILRYLNTLGDIDSWYNGKKYGEIWGFKTDGIIQSVNEKIPDQSKYYAKWSPGDMKYQDLNGDGIINDGQRLLNDHGDLTLIGNSLPRYTFGISAGFNWKNFSFNMFWQGIGKNDFYPTVSNIYWGIIPGGGAGGESAIMKGSPVLDYWRPADETSSLGPNLDAYLPKPYFTSENNKNRLIQSRFILNAAYARLKNLQIGYAVPENLLKKIYIKTARIYISGENLITLTKLPKILDPETVIASPYGKWWNSNGIYPLSRTFSTGLNITF